MMNATVTRFEFKPTVSLADAETSLHMAMFAVEGIFGRARVRLDSSYELNEEDCKITIDVSTEVGTTIVRVFTGLLLREIGEDEFDVKRIDDHHRLSRESKGGAA